MLMMSFYTAVASSMFQTSILVCMVVCLAVSRIPFIMWIWLTDFTRLPSISSYFQNCILLLVESLRADFSFMTVFLSFSLFLFIWRFFICLLPIFIYQNNFIFQSYCSIKKSVRILRSQTLFNRTKNGWTVIQRA